MKTSDFNNFFNNLKKDRETFEHFGFAFLQLTNKQAVKIIDWYKEIGEAGLKTFPNGKDYITFGMNGAVTFPFELYVKMKANETK